MSWTDLGSEIADLFAGLYDSERYRAEQALEQGLRAVHRAANARNRDRRATDNYRAARAATIRRKWHGRKSDPAAYQHALEQARERNRKWHEKASADPAWVEARRAKARERYRRKKIVVDSRLASR